MLIVVIVHTQQSDILPAAQLAVEYDLLFVYLLCLNLAKREKQAIFGKRNWILSLLLNAYVEVEISHVLLFQLLPLFIPVYTLVQLLNRFISSPPAFFYFYSLRNSLKSEKLFVLC